MRVRWWYGALLIIPVALGRSNVREGGNFGPGFVVGSLLAAILFGLIELTRLGVRYFKRK